MKTKVDVNALALKTAERIWMEVGTYKTKQYWLNQILPILTTALSEQEGETRMDCGHLQGDWVERSTDLQPMLLLTGEPEQLVTDGYCRSCKQKAEFGAAELQRGYSEGMEDGLKKRAEAVRDADEKWLYEMCAIDLTPPRDKPIDRKGFVRWLIDSVTYNNVDLFAVETAVEVMQAKAVAQARLEEARKWAHNFWGPYTKEMQAMNQHGDVCRDCINLAELERAVKEQKSNGGDTL